MGATSWRYYTPYQPDPAAALRALREDVFARGDYVDLTGSMADRLRQTARRFGQDPDAPEVRQQIDEHLRLQQAIDTGDTHGLPPAMRGFARRVRQFTQFAARLGATPPPRAGRRPRSIEELLDQAGECGTHSVLDIEEVARRPGLGVASPLSPTAIRRMFSTGEPTRAQVEEHWADVAESLDRLQARFLTVYLDGQPHEYAFVGCSGD
jgi:hypothetical protein